MTKILLIDDDPEFNGSLRDCLEFLGYEVVCAFDGVQGRELFYKERPDVLITDIIMPHQDGYELLMKIGIKTAAGELAFPCKIIALSGGGRIGRDNYLLNAEMMGVDAVMRKPLSFTELNKCIRTLLAGPN